ncbi:hypothetical protein Fmac_009428 [Flemingia macrophylla]|uniref:Uncharacterized protein n=1 Tax=Flemingia macrophylla TaxID=520843 RepID=A0ABD1N075_9FABA
MLRPTWLNMRTSFSNVEVTFGVVFTIKLNIFQHESPHISSYSTPNQHVRETQEYHWLGAVHVRDVAKAHLLLYETPTAAGRYLCTNGINQFSTFA